MPRPLPSTPDSLLERARSAFRQRFDGEPTCAASAPGRVNLIGEHTDYNDGFVLPMAINRFAVIVAAPATTAGSRLYAVDLDDLVQVRLGVVEPREAGWAAGVCAVARELVGRAGRVPAMDIAVTSTVPMGAGLSSSAAIEVAAARLLAPRAGLSLTAIETARLCQAAEHAAGVPCGIMDVYVATHAVADHALLIDCRRLEATPVPMPAANAAAVLVVDTGVRRELAASAYRDRRAACEAAARILGVPALRDVTVDRLVDRSLTAEQRRRARHVVEENDRARAAAAALEAGDLMGLGSLMDRSHESLRDLYEVSCPELDAVVEAARAVGGVYGARMTGAGFGGCAIVLCDPDAVAGTSRRVETAFEARFGRVPPVFEVRAVGAVGA